MEIFTRPDYIQSAFKALEPVAAPCVKVFFDSIDANPHLKKPRIGSTVLQAKEVVANTSSIMRQDSSPTLSALGITTGFSLFQGAFGFEKACHHYHAADTLHDETGKNIALADMASRTGQVAGGGNFAFVRIADVLRGFNTCRNLKDPAALAFTIGSHCFTVLYAGLAVLSFLSLRESGQFLKRVRACEGDMDKLQSLVGKLTGEGIPPSDKKISEKDVYAHLGLALKSILYEIDPKLAMWCSNKKLGKALFTEKYHKYLPLVLDRAEVVAESGDLSVEKLKGNAELVRKIWAREQDAIHERILGSKGMGLVQKAKEMRLHSLLSKTETQGYGKEVSSDLMKEISACAKEQQLIMKAYLLAGTLGAGCSFIGDVASAPFTMIAKLGFLICVWAVAVGDGLGFLESYRSGAPMGEFAKAYVWFHFAVGLTAITTAALLTTASSGLFEIACIVVIGATWIAIDLWMLFGLFPHLEKEHRGKHPTLEEFLQQLDLGKLEFLSEETLEMFHKLPKIQREAILNDLLTNYKAVMDAYVKPLKTFGLEESFAMKTLEERGRRLYEARGWDPKVAEEAFKKACEKLLIAAKPLTVDTLEKHPCKDVFYRMFYNELAKDDQQKALRRIGKERLSLAAKKFTRAAALA